MLLGHSLTQVWMLLLASSIALAQASIPAPPGQLVDLGGRRLHVNCTGAGSPTVIVENGGGSFSVEWALVQPLVAKHNRVCTYDRAGYAWSGRGPVDDGIEQIVDDLHLLLHELGIKTPVILVGHSLGCIYVRAYQRRFPEQVAGLVFVDGTHDEAVTMLIEGERKPISQLSREQMLRAEQDYLRSVPPLKAGAASDPPFDRLTTDLQNERHWAFEKMMVEIGWLPNSQAAAESWRQEFTALRRQRLTTAHPLGNLPLIVLERTQDTNETWHAQQLQLAGLSSASTLLKVEKSGHMMHLDRPDAVAEAISKVIAETSVKK